MEKLARIWVFWWALATAFCATVPIPDNGRASRTKPLVFSLICLTGGTAFLAWRMGRRVPVWAGLAPVSLGTGGMLLALLPNRIQQPWRANDWQSQFKEDWAYLREKPGNWIGLAIFAGLLVIVLIGFGFTRHDHNLATQAKVFDPLLEQYRREFAKAPPGPTPVRAGKMLPLSAETGHVDLSFWDYLPVALRARVPEEVRLLVELKESRVWIAMYTNGKMAYEYRAKVRVLDRDSGRLVADREFRGTPAPPTITEDRDHEGSKVQRDEILRFLESLSKK